MASEARGMSAIRVDVLHGPNLNLLGQRRPDVYGDRTLADIDDSLRKRAEVLGVAVETFQSNSESALVNRIQSTSGEVDGWLVNAAAFTHTSVAIRDALEAAGRPFVEVHLSNIFAREPFRRTSLLTDIAIGIITGFGADSYLLGLEALRGHLRGLA